jgi:thioesterase domain-containing protein
MIPFDLGQLQQYLYVNIPLSKAMGVEVQEAGLERVTLFAPLEPNINHRKTVFGGSASAVAILSAWTLLYVRLCGEGIDSRIVIQKNTVNYKSPITGGFTAVSEMAGGPVWDKFVKTLQRRQRARISVTATLYCEGQRVGELCGDFVALGVSSGLSNSQF